MTETQREKHLACNRRLYARNKVAISASRRSRRLFVDWLKAAPCEDCGASFSPVCMDFDHDVRHPKLFSISKWAFSNLGVEALQTEAGKCSLVCSNCHRMRTFGHRRIVQ